MRDLLRPVALAIKSGQLVILPTMTYYGLCADALNPDAVSRVFKAKGRDPSKPLIVLVDSFEMLKPLVDEIPAAYEPRPQRSVDLRFPHVDAVQARARAQASAIERVLAMGGLTDEQVEGLRAIGTLLYPYVVLRDP